MVSAGTLTTLQARGGSGREFYSAWADHLWPWEQTGSLVWEGKSLWDPLLWPVHTEERFRVDNNLTCGNGQRRFLLLKAVDSCETRGSWTRQAGKCKSVECFVAAVTTFLTNHFSAPHLADPLQIGLTCGHSVPPIIFCAHRQLPLRTRRASRSAARTPSLHLLIQLEFRKKTLQSFVQQKAAKSGLPIFQFLPASFCCSRSVLASQFGSHSVCVCVCSVPLHAVLTHVETSEITFRCCLLIPKTERQRPLCVTSCDLSRLTVFVCV